MRLNWDESQLLKDIKFKMTNNGFEFPQFDTLYGLNIVGNVTQKKTHKYIRFEQMKNSKEGGINFIYNFMLIFERMHVV